MCVSGMCVNEAAASVVEFAAQTGRLDFFSGLLASVAIILTFGGLYGFFVFRSDVKSRAADVAREAASKEVQVYLTANATALIKDALDDAEVVARLHIEFAKLGLDDSEGADNVDTDPDWVPEDAK